MSLVIGITGANGYVGSRLRSTLTAAGHDVIGLVRQPTTAERAFRLGDYMPPDRLAGIDVLIHAAWDMRARTADEVRQTNIDGSTYLLDAAREAGVARQIFISSMSAFAGCRSLYGRGKLEVESRVHAYRGVVIRPGLVYGPEPGGIVGALLGLAKRSPILPMIGTGRFRLHTCHESDLAELAVITCMADEGRLPRLITAAETHGYEFRDIVERLAGRRLLYLPVPWRIAWAGLRAVESLGVRPRMKSDSLIGLVHADPAPDFAPLHALGATFRPLPDRPSGA
jgi:nucleoside-diphosphate-sugar epimerase